MYNDEWEEFRRNYRQSESNLDKQITKMKCPKCNGDNTQRVLSSYKRRHPFGMGLWRCDTCGHHYDLAD